MKIAKALFLLLAVSSVASPSQAQKRDCRRIISLAPSITEMLFAVGLGDNLVAVTRYCKLPPESLRLPQLGGLFDTNLEAGILLKPDLVVGLPESRMVINSFNALEVKALKVSDRSVEEIYSSISAICDHCACREQSSELLRKLRHDSESAISSRKNRRFVSAAVIVASAISGETQELYLSGRDGYYSSIFKLLNARNVFVDNTSAIPSGSFETLVALSPEVVFVIEESLQRFEELERKMRIYLPKTFFVRLSGDHTVIPGPRFPLLMEDIAKGLNLAADYKKQEG